MRTLVKDIVKKPEGQSHQESEESNTQQHHSIFVLSLAIKLMKIRNLSFAIAGVSVEWRVSLRCSH